MKDDQGIPNNSPQDKRPQTDTCAYGLAIGLSLGTAIGIAVDNLAFWMIIGLTLGLCAGPVVSALTGKRENEEHQDE